MERKSQKSWPNISLDNLNMVVEAIRTGELSRVAREYSISQPAITYHIKRLEKALGVALLQRKGNNFLPTSEAEKLIEFARSIDDIKSYFHRSKSKGGAIRKKVTLPEELADLYFNLNSCDLDIEFLSWSILIQNNSVYTDFSLIPSLISDDVFEHPLPKQQLVWVVKPDVLDRQSYSNVGIASPVGVARLLDAALQKRWPSIADRIEVRSSSFAVIRQMVLHHNLIGLLPACMTNEDLLCLDLMNPAYSRISYYYDFYIDRSRVSSKEENFVLEQIRNFLSSRYPSNYERKK